jgi:uncharacterized protein YfcZ (UPF0381/DUF406 family)
LEHLVSAHGMMGRLRAVERMERVYDFHAEPKGTLRKLRSQAESVKSREPLDVQEALRKDEEVARRLRNG